MDHLNVCREVKVSKVVKITVLVLWGVLFSTSGLAQTRKAVPLSIGESFDIESKVLKERRHINVYMPPGYSESANVRVPVLYMPDGGIKEDFLHVAGLVQVLVGNESMRPFLVVGIENTERRRDMTGPTENEQDKKIAKRVGGSAEFRWFIKSELMPEIKARYRTTNETAIVGESLAGLFVLETLFLDPDLFDTYIAIDPSIWWNNGKLIDAAAEKLSSKAVQQKVIFVALSSEEYVPGQAKKFESIMLARQPMAYGWYLKWMPEEKHSTIYHPAALEAFRTVFKTAKKS